MSFLKYSQVLSLKPKPLLMLSINGGFSLIYETTGAIFVMFTTKIKI